MKGSGYRPKAEAISRWPKAGCRKPIRTMRNIRFVVGLVIAVALVLAGYLILRGTNVLGLPTLADVKPVPSGHQEVAWLAPATSDEAWERLVAGVRYLIKEWPKWFPETPPLQANFERAFLDPTADIPEVGLTLTGAGQGTLWLRWYKISSEIGSKVWLQKLAARKPPPLAILGGDTSDRAVHQAGILQEHLVDWQGKAPLYLITTATADRHYPGHYRPGGTSEDSLTRKNWPRVMEVYKGHSFRFSFSNTRMANAVMEFIREHPEVWLTVKREPTFIASLVGNGTGLGSLNLLAAGGYFQDYHLYAPAWADDVYSLDLADRFIDVFLDKFNRGRDASITLKNIYIAYGVGDYYSPNPREALTANMFLVDVSGFRNHNQMLVLPTTSQRARRFLRTLCGMAPLDIRNLVVMSGDAITFNNIYRDRDLAWNILDMPVPLVFFCHRNPVNKAAGFGQKIENHISTTGTQDMLLYADVLNSLVQAAFQKQSLLADAEELKQRLQDSQWYKGRVINPGFAAVPAGSSDLFTPEGDRSSKTGEHIVWLKPEFTCNRVDAKATITVWRIGPQGWYQVPPPLEVEYNAMPPQGNHAPD
jgi:hypothetical protein